MRERKAEILRYLNDDDPTEDFPPPPIMRVPRGPQLPLSFAQERLWFLEQLEPGNSAYNICRAARLRGSLDYKALEASLNEIAHRHEVLRTSFEVIAGQPIQVISTDAKLELGRADLSQFVESDRDHEINRLIAEGAQRPFDLSQAPLLRANLFRLDDWHHVFILATHHIVADAWSMGILTRELWSVYQAFAQDRQSPLEDLGIQYADFVALAKKLAAGRCARIAAFLLEETARRYSYSQSPDRPVPSAKTELSWYQGADSLGAIAHGGDQ